ncbi:MULTISPECIES: LysR family transcriptional regulator [Acetobacterales]|uniref:LysR family transcriptional regulator n=1 Tax=Roseomonas sp. WGS1072 TaxID=3366816 RepID=UPI003BF20D67
MPYFLDADDRDVPNLRHLRLLAAVAAGMSLRRAASELHISQSAATLSLTALEARYRVTLFERRPSGLVPTKHGVALAARTERCLAYLGAALQRLGGRSQGVGVPAQRLSLLRMPQLLALVAMEEAGGFTAAARRLGLRPPSIHRAMGELEDALGLELVLRGQGGARLNAAGLDMARGCSLALSELRAARAELRELDGETSGRVVVGAVRLTASGIIPQVIQEMYRQWPGARFAVVTGDYEDMVHGIRTGRIDYLCTTLRADIPDGVEAEIIFSSAIRIACHKAHPIAGSVDPPARELARWPWVVPAAGTGAAARFRTIFEAEGVPPPNAHVTSASFDLTRSLLLGGEFLALIVEGGSATDFGVSDLHVLSKAIPNDRRPVYLLWRKNWSPTRLQQQFRATIQKACRQA